MRSVGRGQRKLHVQEKSYRKSEEKRLCVCVTEETYTQNANVREGKWRLHANKQRIRVAELPRPCVSGWLILSRVNTTRLM